MMDFCRARGKLGSRDRPKAHQLPCNDLAGYSRSWATFMFRFGRIRFRFELNVGMEKVDVKVELDESFGARGRGS
jgi:hypothetical protein